MYRKFPFICNEKTKSAVFPEVCAAYTVSEALMWAFDYIALTTSALVVVGLGLGADSSVLRLV